MAKYRVTAGVVAVQRGNRVDHHYRGGIVDLDRPAADMLVGRGMIEPADAPRRAAEDSPAVEVGQRDAAEPNNDVDDPRQATDTRPRKAAAHAAWVDYAVDTGQMSRDLATTLTRADIIAQTK